MSVIFGLETSGQWRNVIPWKCFQTMGKLKGGRRRRKVREARMMAQLRIWRALLLSAVSYLFYGELLLAVVPNSGERLGVLECRGDAAAPLVGKELRMEVRLCCFTLFDRSACVKIEMERSA